MCVYVCILRLRFAPEGGMSSPRETPPGFNAALGQFGPLRNPPSNGNNLDTNMTGTR